MGKTQERSEGTKFVSLSGQSSLKVLLINLSLRLEYDAALFHDDTLSPLLGRVKRGGAFRLGVMAGKENFLAGVPYHAVAIQGKNHNAFAVDAWFRVLRSTAAVRLPLSAAASVLAGS